MELNNEVVLVQMDQRVGGVGPLGGGDALLEGQHGDVLVGKTQGGQDMQVHQIVCVVIAVGGALHVGRSGSQAGQKGHRQRRQQKQGEKPAGGLSDLPESVGQETVGFLLQAGTPFIKNRK